MDGRSVRTACVVLILYFAGAATVVSAHRSVTALPPSGGRTAPLLIEKDGGIVVMVRIQGAGPFRFRLDTGASRTVISRELASRIGLVGSGSSVLVTPTGRAVRPLATVGDLTAGCVSGGDLRAAVVPTADLEPGAQVDGLIGQDLLFAHVYTLDYERALLGCLPPDRDSTSAARLPLTVVDGRALVSLPQSRGPLRLVPDSGADRLVLFTRRGQPLNALVTPREIGRARSVAGQRVVRRVVVEALQVGDARLGDREGLLVEAPDPDLMGDGLLPLHLFARVTFNGPAGYVTIEPRR